MTVRRRLAAIECVCCLALVVAAVPRAQSPTPTLKKAAAFDLPGPGGRRFDYLTIAGNHGMTLDPERHRAFLSCEGNNLMTVFNLDTHAPVAFLNMAAGPDVIKFDPGLKRIYAGCSSGAISVFQMDDPDHYRKLEDFAVEKRVHSLTVDPATHRVYAPEQEEGGRPVARMIVYDAVSGG